jgi:hypothetical protein
MPGENSAQKRNKTENRTFCGALQKSAKFHGTAELWKKRLARGNEFVRTSGDSLEGPLFDARLGTWREDQRSNTEKTEFHLNYKD